MATTLQELKKIFSDELAAKGLIAKRSDLMRAGATYKDVMEYASEVGSVLSSLLKGQTADLTAVTAEYMTNLIKPMLLHGYSFSADAAAIVQETLNNAAGIGFSAVLPDVKNVDRINNLVQRVIEDGAENVPFAFNADTVQNICQAAVVDTAKKNAELHENAGLTVTVTRVTDGHCCEWCDKMAGTYKLGDIPDGFWAFHKSCTCYIDYKPTKGKWSRVSYSTSGGKMSKNTTDI